MDPQLAAATATMHTSTDLLPITSAALASIGIAVLCSAMLDPKLIVHILGPNPLGPCDCCQPEWTRNGFSMLQLQGRTLSPVDTGCFAACALSCGAAMIVEESLTDVVATG